MSDIINVIAVVFFLLCWGLIIRKIVITRFAPVKAAKAIVVDKYKADTVSKHPGTFKEEHYIVVFEIKNKRLSFGVSEYSYNNYRINEKGILKYKGSKIISFQS